MKVKAITKIISALALLIGFWGTAFANVVPWDRELAYPVPMTAEQIALADEELLPENVNKTFIALASENGQKLPDEEKADESEPLVEVTFSTRRGVEPSDSYGAVTVYAEIPFGTDGYSVWFSGYKDPAFTGNYFGLAKKFGSWQVGLGAGNVHYGEVRHTVINPWVYYDSEEWEAYVHAEHYSRESENPWWYKGYVEKKVGDWGLGLYGDKDMGIGPKVSYKLNDHVKVWATVPMWQQPETGKMKFFVNVVFTF